MYYKEGSAGNPHSWNPGNFCLENLGIWKVVVKSIILGFGIRNTATCKLVQNATNNNIGIQIQVPLTKNLVAGIQNP